MQVGRSYCSGQAFVMAIGGGSEGKKHRSRMTKEERKKAVESFVRRHRASNNGKFPSLNLTHKEVGGSFYTVREIVREIIQDNRILCPGNISSQSFTLDNSSLVTVQPSRVEMCDDVSVGYKNHNIDGIRVSAMGENERESSSEDEAKFEKEAFISSKLEDISSVHDNFVYSEINGVYSGNMASFSVVNGQPTDLMAIPSVASVSSVIDGGNAESVVSPTSKDEEQHRELEKLVSSELSTGEHEHSDYRSNSQDRGNSIIVEDRRELLKKSLTKNPGDNPFWIIIKGLAASLFKLWFD